MAESNKQIVVAALNFGATHSCYAFSLRHDPKKIHMNPIWFAGSTKFMSMKTATCLLLNRDKQFVAFGYDAEDQYAKQSLNMLDDEKENYYFFQHFTMNRHINKITRKKMIDDVTGKSLPANYVFKMFIQAIVDHSLKKTNALDLRKSELRWVITFSTDFTSASNHFLRECAEQAGIPPGQLMIIPDAAAAFVFYQKMLNTSELQDGTEYIIADLEGCFADITVIQKDNDQLIEKYRTTSYDCGSTLVNDRFLELLEDVCGPSVLSFLRNEQPEIYLEIEREIEREIGKCKRSIDSNKRDKITMVLPFVSLDEVCLELTNKDFNSLLQTSKHAYTIKKKADKLHIDINKFRNLFRPTVDKVVFLIEKVFTNYKEAHNSTNIIMIGAFSECYFVQDAVREKFPSKHIIIPEEAKLVVVKGAVIYGHNPYPYTSSIVYSENSDSILAKLRQLNKRDFEDLVALGTYASYENRVYLAGPCNTGKSSLASILIGEAIPKKWISTDGLIIHFGRNGIDLQRRKMVPLKKGRGDVLTKLLLGNPELEEVQEQSYAENAMRYHDDDVLEVKDDPSSEIGKHGGKIDNSNEDQLLYTRTESSKSKQRISEGCDKNTTKSRIKAIFGKFIKTRSTKSSRGIQSHLLGNIKKEHEGDSMFRIVPSDLVDFGGQKSYDMTHPLFIQHRGTFILMFDGRKGLYTDLVEYPQGNVTAASNLEHWINSVLTYCNKSDDKMPRILFAATHSDNFSEEEKDKLTLQFKEELKKLFSTHKLQDHIMYDKVFFINATDINDLNVERLKNTLVDIAHQQVTWGQRIPMVWLPLDLQISNMRTEGVKIITKETLLEINKSNDKNALTERRLEDFLLVQHSIGKILYFDEPALRDFIVIQPTAMVNILRAVVTDKMFWPKKGSRRNILKNLSSTGVLKKTDLLKLWCKPVFKDVLRDNKTKEYIIKLLLHLDILVEPKRYTVTDKESDLFLVPCLVTEQIPQNIQKNAVDDRTICIAYNLKETVVPSALAFKLIGASLSIWPLKTVDSRFCLFFQSAVMDADDRNEIQICVEGQKIIVYLINEVSKALISPDLATITQESLTLALERILQFYNRCFGKTESQVTSDMFEIEVGEVCKGRKCLIPVSEAKRLNKWRCQNGFTHETKWPLNWVYVKNQDNCDTECKGLERQILCLRPNDQHFVQLAQTIGIGDYYNFFINLGMKNADYDNLNFRYFSNPMDFMLMGLFEWRDTEESNKSIATFEKLQKALTAIDRQHCLCQVYREDHSLIEIAQTSLQVAPSDDVIHTLTEKKLIGDCVVHLGVELGINIGDIKETMHNFPKDLNGQINDLLVKWKNLEKSDRTKPTIYRLMRTLKRIKSAEGLAFVKKAYDVE